MKKAKDLHAYLDKALDDVADETVDHKRGGTMARIAQNKIKLAGEQVKYKKLTGRPDKVEFFED